MNNSKNKNNNKKNIKNENLTAHNDQLGENASEEYRSEDYANAMKNKVDNKGLK
jgi:hypothetical protein